MPRWWFPTVHTVTEISSQRQEIDASLKLAAVGMTRQDTQRDRANLERARGLAEDLHDEPRLAQVLYWLGRIHYVLWEPPTTIEYARRSLEIADRLRDEALAAPLVNLMGRVCWLQGDFANAGQMMARSVEQMRRLGKKNEEATAAGIAGWVFGVMGEFDRALTYAEEGLGRHHKILNSFLILLWSPTNMILLKLLSKDQSYSGLDICLHQEGNKKSPQGV